MEELSNDQPPLSPKRRSSRRSRVRRRPLRLRGRDVDIVQSIAKLRLARTSDVSRLFFGSPGTCQKRLRKLFDAGLIRAVVTDLAAENRYALTPLGHRFLVQVRPDEAPRWRSAPRVDARSLAHLDTLNRYRVALAVSAARFDVTLARFSPEWELRSATPDASLIPDAAVILNTPNGAVHIGLEVDTGTEPTSTVVRKIVAYEACRARGESLHGLHDPLVLFVVPTVRRARSIANALRQTLHDVKIMLALIDRASVAGGLDLACAEPRDVLEANGVFARSVLGAGRHVSQTPKRALR